MSEVVNGKKMPGSEVLIAIGMRFGVNLHWLLLGEEPQAVLERAKLVEEVASKLNRLASELRQQNEY